MSDEPKKTLEEKAQDLAWEVSKRPDIYIKLIRVINFLARIVGLILTPINKLRGK